MRGRRPSGGVVNRGSTQEPSYVRVFSTSHRSDYAQGSLTYFFASVFACQIGYLFTRPPCDGTLTTDPTGGTSSRSSTRRHGNLSEEINPHGLKLRPKRSVRGQTVTRRTTTGVERNVHLFHSKGIFGISLRVTLLTFT